MSACQPWFGYATFLRSFKNDSDIYLAWVRFVLIEIVLSKVSKTYTEIVIYFPTNLIPHTTIHTLLPPHTKTIKSPQEPTLQALHQQCLAVSPTSVTTLVAPNGQRRLFLPRDLERSKARLRLRLHHLRGTRIPRARRKRNQRRRSTNPIAIILRRRHR